MEVLRVDDFDLLFVTEPPEDQGREPEETGALKRKKDPTHGRQGKTAAVYALVFPIVADGYPGYPPS